MCNSMRCACLPVQQDTAERLALDLRAGGWRAAAQARAPSPLKGSTALRHATPSRRPPHTSGQEEAAPLPPPPPPLQPFQQVESAGAASRPLPPPPLQRQAAQVSVQLPPAPQSPPGVGAAEAGPLFGAHAGAANFVALAHSPTSRSKVGGARARATASPPSVARPPAPPAHGACMLCACGQGFMRQCFIF